MLTFHRNFLVRRSAAFLLSAGLLGCTDKAAEEQTPATRFCSTLSEYATACPALATPCDQAMIGDCTSVVALVSDGFLQTATDCITDGGSPLGCLGGAIVGLTPSPAHEAFVGQFCEACAFGVPGCADVLLGKTAGSPELAAASALILPLGDSLVDALREQCTSGLTCLATFPSCAQKVLVEQAIPEQTLQCVLDGFQGKLPEGAPTPEELAACGLGGASTGGASGASGASAASASEATPTTGGETDAVSSGGEDPSTSTTSTDPTNADDSSTGGPVDPSNDTTGDDTTGTPDTDTGAEQACIEAYEEHDECSPGGALPSDCTVCAYLICSFVDGYCCTTAWDEQCAAAANERCSAACGGPGVCAHSPCEVGAALDGTCSDCVLSVCSDRPSCCDTEWDSECAIAAANCGSC